MSIVNNLSLESNRQIKINFDGGDLSSDAGLLLIKEFVGKLGIDKLLGKAFKTNDPALFRYHTDQKNLLQMIYMIIAGYFEDDASDELTNDPSSDRQEAFEDRLHKYAYIFLAQIGNLNEVIYEYKVEGETRILSVTSSEASEFAGEDIKTVGTDIFLLEELVKKTELSNVVIGGAAVDSNAQVDFSNSGQTEKVLGFTVVNYAEDDICEVYLSVEAGKTSAHQSMSRADGASLLSGENVDFQLIPEDFAKEIKDGSKATIKLSVKDPKGNSHKVQGEVYVDLFWGSKYKLNLSGDTDNGYFLGH